MADEKAVNLANAIAQIEKSVRQRFHRATWVTAKFWSP